MLSSLSSFLPSALSEKLERLEPRAEQSGRTDNTDDHEGAKPQDMADGTKKEKRKKSTSNETFIVVRPPPAKSNHPLNLQLQLVPAQQRDRSSTSATTTPTNSRLAFDPSQRDESAAAQPPPSPAASETDHQGNGLQRTMSVRSDRSEVSTFYASGSLSGSVTSFASTTSTASGRRMIIPLYNLHAHNVMTNTILDAGTDAKVAKFHKRGIEIIDLAILEPTEVWSGPTNPNGTDPLAIPVHRSQSRNSLVPPGQSGSRAATPDQSQHSPGSSKLSLSSEQSSTVAHPTDHATPSATPHSGAKKIFGRIFRKKEGSGGGGNGHTPTPSVASVTLVEPPNIPEVRIPTVAPRQEIILPPVLGLSPTLAGAANPPTGRCVAHVWTVRRWLKTDNQGLISGVIGKISREVSYGHGATPESMEWEVRFEWARRRSKDEKARKLARRASVIVGGGEKHSRTPSRRSSTVFGVETLPQDEHDSPRQSLDVTHRRARSQTPSSQPTTGPQASSVASTAPSDDGSTTGDDPGDESDPEDSETPWTCTLVLAHPSHPIAPKTRSHIRTHSSSGAPAAAPTSVDTTPLRLKVATLAPAPHHPKVVCQLKVLFPLPDAEVERGVLCKRLVLPDGTTRSTVSSERPGLVMTAEEIKDVVCSTAFWVVVRQGFGGLGKKTRKGDGWKIRG